MPPGTGTDEAVLWTQSTAQLIYKIKQQERYIDELVDQINRGRTRRSALLARITVLEEEIGWLDDTAFGRQVER